MWQHAEVKEELERLNAELSQQAAHLREVNQTLLESEQRLRLAIETGRIGLWVWNSTDLNNAGDWSQRMKEIFGLPLDADVTHDMFLKCVHPDDRARVDRSVMQALAGANGGEYDIEYRTIHPKEGFERWVTARGQAFFDGDGRAVRFIGTVMDITERKRAEQASVRLNIELEKRIDERTAALAEYAEALRASEHLARGQFAALTRTLDALAQESDPERLLEHVLRTIAARLNGQSVSVYERTPTNEMDMVATFEDDRLQVPSRDLPSVKSVKLFMGDHPVWGEVLRTGVDVVIGEIDCDPPRVRLGSREGSPWYPWHGDAPHDPNMPVVYRRLAAMGVVATLTVPTLIGGKLAGFIGIRSKDKDIFRTTEMELARALAHQAMLAVQLMRLSRQSREAAITAERNRMARDLHDTLAQGFTGVIVQLEAAEDALSRGLSAEARNHLTRASELARWSLKEARLSARALRPQALAEQNLCKAMQELISKMTSGTSVAGAFTQEGEPWPLSLEWEENLLRIGQEVLTNTLRHARARHFKAHLAFEREGLRFELRDDGAGFDPASLNEGLGLLGIKERVEMMGGELTIQSAEGEGTAIFASLPAPNQQGGVVI
jgi:PAS domain S-box-containing protein